MLQPFREQRLTAIKEYAGYHYGEDALRDKNPINLIGQYLGIMPRFLVPKNPRFLLTTFKKSSKAPAGAMQSSVNQQVERMYLAETLRQWVIDGLFLIGIMKVCMASPAESAETGWQVQAGTAIARTVDFGDFVFDTHCRVIERASYAGHRFRMDRDVAIEMYGKKVKDLAVSTDNQFNIDGDEKTQSVATGISTFTNEYREWVDLWEIYDPALKRIITLSDDALMGATETGIDKALEEKDWIGPYCGPYHYLKFKSVPGNPLPKGEILDLLDLHQLANSLYRKLGDTADSAKQIGLAMGGETEDANKIMKAAHLDVVSVNRPDSFTMANFGQMDQSSYTFMMDNVQRFKELGGNIDLLGGLNPQSSTATQDKMLNQNATGNVADKQQDTLAGVSAVGKALCWFWWNDPVRTFETQYEQSGAPELTLPRSLYPAAPKYTDPTHPEYEQVDLVRSGRFEDLEIKVDPYSMRFASPEQKVASLTAIMTNIVIPLMPMLQPAGITADLAKFLEIVAQYEDLPELQDIVTMADPPQTAQGGMGGAAQPGAPGQTERRYVRESVSGRTQKGNERNMMSSLMGVNPGGASKNGKPMMG